MRIIEIKTLPNGAHRNQTASACPDGWAIIPDDMECENFPFGSVTVVDGVVTEWTPGEIPAPPAPTSEELREAAYNSEPIITWEDKLITVTAAAQLWQYYAAEGSEIATRLTALIAAAKEEIRSRIHD
jgi:hypothetical protein